MLALHSLFLSGLLPFTYAPVNAQNLRSIPPTQKLVPNHSGPGDDYGTAVAMQRNRIAVGARRGNEDTGVVHVYERETQQGVWVEVDALTSASGALNTHFGYAIAMEGDTIVVGAPEDRAAGFPGYGAVSVFERTTADPSSWTLVAELRSSDQSGRFGETVDISGDTILVGAPDIVDNPGAAYLYERNLGGPDAWGEAQKLMAPNGLNHVSFADGVGIDGDTLVVSRTRARAVQGINTVSLFVYERPSGTANGWTHTTTLLASNASGTAHLVGISGDTIGVLGRITTRTELRIFERARSTGTWDLVAEVPNPEGLTNIGSSLAVHPDAVIVGCNNCNGAGAVYLVQRLGGNAARWVPTATYPSPLASTFIRYGTAVDFFDGTAVIGARATSSSNPGMAYSAMVPSNMPLEIDAVSPVAR